MSVELIPGYPDGSDITLINTFYQYPKRKESSGKKREYTDDILTVLFRDNVTGEKKIVDIKKPEYTYYKAKEGVKIAENELFTEIENCEEITVPYSDLLKSIAVETGEEDFFYGNLKNKTMKENKLLHTIKGIFNSDMNIEDHFRYKFGLHYPNNTFRVTKAFFDIETLLRDVKVKGEIPEAGTLPINALTYINQNHDVHIFLLRDKLNPQVDEFEQELRKGNVIAKLRKFVEDHVGGEKRARIIHKINDLKYHFHMYNEEDEIHLIADFFKLVNFDKPDFCLAWNAGFDIPFLIERIRALGYNPLDICCPPECESKVAFYRLDLQHKSVPAEKGDQFFITGYTIWDDQMRHFASKRKGQSAFEHYSLDYIGTKIANVGKLDYSSLGATIYDLNEVNYLMFVFYNVCDVIVQVCIENKADDMSYVFNKCLMNGHQYHKCHRQSVYLTDRATAEFRKDGFIICNNKNRFNEKPKIKYPGAMVGEMHNVTDYARTIIAGAYINMAKNVNDFDYKSLYPSITIQNNMAPNTQIGRIIIDQEVHPNENRFGYNKYMRGGGFIEDFESDNFVEFCHRWLHLGGYKEVYKDIIEYFTKIKRPYGSIQYIDKRIVHLVDEIKPEPLCVYTDDPIRKETLVQFEYNENYDYTNILAEISKNAQMTIDSFEHIMRRKQSEMEEDEEFNKFLESFEEPKYDPYGEEDKVVMYA